MDRLMEAIKWYDKALEIDGNYTDAVNNRCMIHDEYGSWQLSLLR